jgi:hypothetical protein
MSGSLPPPGSISARKAAHWIGRHCPRKWRFSCVGAESLRVRRPRGFVVTSRPAAVRGCGYRSRAARQAMTGRRRGRHVPGLARPSRLAGGDQPDVRPRADGGPRLGHNSSGGIVSRGGRDACRGGSGRTDVGDLEVSVNALRPVSQTVWGRGDGGRLAPTITGWPPAFGDAAERMLVFDLRPWASLRCSSSAATVAVSFPSGSPPRATACAETGYDLGTSPPKTVVFLGKDSDPMIPAGGSEFPSSSAPPAFFVGFMKG